MDGRSWIQVNLIAAINHPVWVTTMCLAINFTLARAWLAWDYTHYCYRDTPSIAENLFPGNTEMDGKPVSLNKLVLWCILQYSLAHEKERKDLSPPHQTRYQNEYLLRRLFWIQQTMWMVKFQQTWLSTRHTAWEAHMLPYLSISVEQFCFASQFLVSKNINRNL